jgi:hypothetical protein
MTSPFPSIGFARGNDPDGMAAHRVDHDEQPAADAATLAQAPLAFRLVPFESDEYRSTA